MPIAGISRSKAFERDYRKLDSELQSKVDEAIEDLLRDPIPSSRRFEKLRGYKNPAIFTVHVTPNHSHKMSLELRDGNIAGLRGDIAHLRRVATHKEIDRLP